MANQPSRAKPRSRLRTWRRLRSTVHDAMRSAVAAHSCNNRTPRLKRCALRAWETLNEPSRNTEARSPRFTCHAMTMLLSTERATASRRTMAASHKAGHAPAETSPGDLGPRSTKRRRPERTRSARTAPASACAASCPACATTSRARLLPKARRTATSVRRALASAAKADAMLAYELARTSKAAAASISRRGRTSWIRHLEKRTT
jgi:hypothetical protein